MPDSPEMPQFLQMPDLKARPEAKPLPEKPLAECTVADLKGLTEPQLAKLLFRSSTYATKRDIRISRDPASGITYSLEMDLPPEDGQPAIASEFVVGDVVEEEVTDDITTKRVSIKTPYIKGGTVDYFTTQVLPGINSQLAEKNLPQITSLAILRANEKKLEGYWSDPQRLLKEHNYSGGRLHTPYETLEGQLAQEVRDLEALGLDFDDITAAIDPVIADIKTAMKKFQGNEELQTQTDFQCTGKTEDDVPASYSYVSTRDPDIHAETKWWNTDVINIPFPHESSVYDHEVSRVSQKGWNIPLSEVSESLYKQRVIEGNSPPHYRVSAARTVWALEMGDKALQAKAFGLDWNNTTAALERAISARDKVHINVMMNYIVDHFPRDDSHWKGPEFSGYHYGETQYDSLRNFYDGLKERVSAIPFWPNIYTVELKEME